MNQEAYITASTHSVAVLYTCWNYEGMLLMIPMFNITYQDIIIC